MPRQVLLEILPPNILLGNVVNPVDAADLVNLHDVGMNKRSGSLSFSLKPLYVRLITCQLRPQNL